MKPIPSAMTSSMPVVLVFALHALALILRGKMRSGCMLFAAATLPSLVFGLFFHDLLDAPERCSNVRGAGAQQFAAPAVVRYP
jgi:hypothetical protein